MRTSLGLLDKKREQVIIILAAYQQEVMKYYNKKVRTRNFCEGDLVLRRVTQNTKALNEGAFEANWEGPYKVLRIIKHRVYKLQYLDGREVKKPWNTKMLKKYFP